MGKGEIIKGGVKLGVDVAEDILRRIIGDAAPASAPNPNLRRVYDLRAEQMQVKNPKKRIQPREGRAPFVDTDYMTPAPSGALEDMSAKYPRNPDPMAPLPLGDRARVLVDRRNEIAQRLADRIAMTGQLGANTRYFYHSDGPLYRAAIKSGLSPDEASAWLRDFGNTFAATSPRTEVEFNIRNALSAMAKEAQGIPHRDIVGPGSGGISEAGYPMMTGKGGIHGKLLDEVFSGRGINTNENTKPYFFGNNMVGNRSGVTVDTHAIRGVLQTLNELEPGSVPEGFIMPEFREAYRADPSKLTPNMIADTIGTQMVGPRGSAVSMQTEYPVFADIFHDVADRLGVSPAEAQSMAWFGLGDETNLASAPKTVAEVFDERLDVTSQAMGIPVEEVARMVFRREIPLLGVGGAAAGGLLSMQPGEAQASPRSPEDEMIQYLKSIEGRR